MRARRSRRWRGSRRRSFSTSARCRATGSRRCCSPAASRPRAGSPSCSTLSAPAPPSSAPSTSRRILELVDVTVLRGNAGEVATLVGAEAEVRGVESMAAGVDAGGARAHGGAAARRDRVGHRPRRPRERRRARARGCERPPAARDRHGNRLHVVGADRLLPRGEAGRAARGGGRGARGVRRRGGRRRRRRRRAGHLPRAPLRRALCARPGRRSTRRIRIEEL